MAPPHSSPAHSAQGLEQLQFQMCKKYKTANIKLHLVQKAPSIVEIPCNW